MNTAKITEKKTDSLWNYYRDKSRDPLSSNSEFFKYKRSITENTYNLGVGEAGYDANKASKNETEVVIPIKHLSNFLRTLNIPLVNCEIELILVWSKNFVLADMTARAAGDNNDPPVTVAPTGLEFQITGTKLYVPVVTLSKENDKQLLEQLMSGFERTLKWNKSSIFNYSDAYSFATGDIAVKVRNAADTTDIALGAITQLASKNCAQFKDFRTEK